MKERPGHIDQRDLARILREQWGLVPGRLRHLPVGFGDHHWELTGAAGGRWFVTVAELAGGWRGAGPAAGFVDLRASMETVTALHRAGLEFAVAPVPTVGGQALARLGAGHAVAVFPYVGRAAGDFGDGLPERDRLALIAILARLHGATPLARRTALARSPTPASRPALEAALGELGQPWSGGPYSEPARRLLARQAARLGRALARFDELVRAAAGSGPPVITHGEPHPGNIMRSGGRLLLIDWDTVGLAPPERDLSLIIGEAGEGADRYHEVAGRAFDPSVLTLYRARWYLDDLASAVRLFRRPHSGTADTERWFDGLAPRLARLPEWLGQLG